MGAERDLKAEMLRNKYAVQVAYFRNRWNKFSHSLIHENRFVLQREDTEFINEITDSLINLFTTELPKGSKFYRARIILGTDLSLQKCFYRSRKNDKENARLWIPRKSTIKGYSNLSEVGIPPKDKAGSNRASPKGMPYLYVADNIYTAVSEVRPSIQELVNVVKFENQSPLKVIMMPRTFGDLKAMSIHDEETNLYIRTIAQLLSFEFSRPIRRGEEDLDYLPTQYLVSSIRAKDASIQGISYPSFQSHAGMNYVVFHQEDLTLTNEPEKIIRVQNLIYDCCNLNDLSERINPQQTDYDPTLTDEDVDEIKNRIHMQTEP